jgi:hypothetical protein
MFLQSDSGAALWPRRRFLKMLGAVALSPVFARAGPFTPARQGLSSVLVLGDSMALCGFGSRLDGVTARPPLDPLVDVARAGITGILGERVVDRGTAKGELVFAIDWGGGGGGTHGYPFLECRNR